LSTANSNRARILELARISPGIHLRELERVLNLSLHSVRYHVDSLTKSGLIICDKKTGYSRIFPIGTVQQDIVLIQFLRVVSSRRIVTALTKPAEGLSNKEICEKTNLAKSTVSEIVQKLLENHIVFLELSESGVKVRLHNSEYVSSLLDGLGPVLESKDVVQSFVDLWDF
jgi:predicted transcriptional regulator